MRIPCFLFIVMLALSGIAAKAQTVYDKYVDFNDAIVQQHPDKAMALGMEILNSSEKLPAKTQTKFYAFMAKLYEDDKQVDNAIKYYELVTAAAPDYYIAHRALGYLYLDKAQAALLSNDTRVALQHDKWWQLAIPHLEKDEACNPDKEELEQIKTLYDKLSNKTGLKTLDSRLKQLSGKCVDLLTD
jgi:tetratricopeptide (TPR) repeat protein